MAIALKPSTATAITYTNCCGAFFIMVQIFGLMSFLGGFSFIGFGLCVANSIEAQNSKIASNIMTGLAVIGMLCFLIGLIGLFVVS